MTREWTSPKELIAAARLRLLRDAVSALIGQAASTRRRSTCRPTCRSGRDPAAGSADRHQLTVRGEVEGLDAEQFAKAAADARWAAGQQGA